ncbi:unnamed protein product [Lota lota]
MWTVAISDANGVNVLLPAAAGGRKQHRLTAPCSLSSFSPWSLLQSSGTAQELGRNCTTGLPLAPTEDPFKRGRHLCGSRPEGEGGDPTTQPPTLSPTLDPPTPETQA